MKHDVNKDEAIKSIYGKYGDRTPNALRSKENSGLRQYLFDRFPMLQEEKYTDGMRIYWLINGTEDFPPCENKSHGVHKNTTHRCRIRGYETPYCCPKCAHEAGCSKAKATKLEKYGNENWNNPEKRAATNIITYGCENAACNQKVIDKIQSKRKPKMKELSAKAWNTRRRNSTEKFGDFPYWDKLFLQFLDKSGWTGFERRHYSKAEKFKLRFKIKSYAKMKSKGKFKPDFSIGEWMANENPFEAEMNWICPDGHRFKSKMKTHYSEYLRCPICDPYLDVGTSKTEKEMQEFLNFVWPHPETDRNRRDIIKPLELDDYITDKKIAFEFDGLYTHCDINKKNGYHQMKTKMCRSRGIRLIHIFEDEWRNKRNVCESYVKTALGLNAIVDARGLNVSDVDTMKFYDFASSNCIEKPRECESSYGLYDGNTLMFAVGFKHTWANKYEMVCPCCKLGYNVIGAIDAVVQRFISDHSPSYISLELDRRWFNETSLSDVKTMRLTDRLRSGFYYVNYGYDTRYRPDEISERLLQSFKRYDSNASLEENIKLCKFARIYDCGKLVYTWKKKTALDIEGGSVNPL